MTTAQHASAQGPQRRSLKYTSPFGKTRFGNVRAFTHNRWHTLPLRASARFTVPIQATSTAVRKRNENEAKIDPYRRVRVMVVVQEEGEDGLIIVEVPEVRRVNPVEVAQKLQQELAVPRSRAPKHSSQWARKRTTQDKISKFPTSLRAHTLLVFLQRSDSFIHTYLHLKTSAFVVNDFIF